MTLKQSSQNVNNLSSLFKFTSDLNSFPLLSQPIPPLYGLIDNQFNPIYPKKEMINENGVLHTTQQLFDELKNDIKLYKLRGAFSKKNEKLVDIQIHKGYSTPQAFEDSFSGTQKELSDTISTRTMLQSEVNLKTSKKVQKFSFFEDFFEFFKEEYVRSKFLSYVPMTMYGNQIKSVGGGLMLEIDDAQYNNNEEYKVEMYHLNDDYDLFRQIAYKHGFKTDKNIPWRLYLDLNSPRFIKELDKKFKKDLAFFFKTCYNKIYSNISDIYELFNNIWKNISKRDDDVLVVPNGTTSKSLEKRTREKEKTFKIRKEELMLLKIEMILRETRLFKNDNLLQINSIKRDIVQYKKKEKNEEKVIEKVLTCFYREVNKRLLFLAMSEVRPEQ